MEQEIHEGAREINSNNVMYWSTHYKELQGSFKKKSLFLLQHECIKYVGDDPEFNSKYTFLCLPLNTEEETVFEGVKFHKKPFTTDYNSTVYKIYKNKDGKFSCTCQGWNTKEKKGEGREDGCQCAHTLALFLAFKCKHFSNK